MSDNAPLFEIITALIDIADSLDSRIHNLENNANLPVGNTSADIAALRTKVTDFVRALDAQEGK